MVHGTGFYSWVGAPGSDDDPREKLVGPGPLGNGDFEIFLSEVLRRLL